MEGIRGEQSIAELCRKYSISDSTYCNGIRNLLRLAKLALMVIPSVKQRVMR
ncbi:hypothetical protein [Segatella salivae]|uniref:hypothetical protein n=1 Tax=Segatella salivae TaxID=228604 RepID=UPI0026915008